MKQIDHYNILLVEDEYYVRQAIKRAIDEQDDIFIVAGEAAGADEALALLKKEAFHIVFTDICMPGMNGLSLAKQISQLYPDIKIVILTGYADFAYAQEAIRNGVCDYLLKPVEAEALSKTLGKINSALSKIYELPEDEMLKAFDAQSVVEKIIDHMQNHYMEQIDFGSLSADYGISPAYMTKIFKKHAENTPVKMLTDIRIHKAKHLLATTNLSIQEIGEAVGYPDQFHFSKTFRKAVDMNPSAYRSEHSK